MEALAVKYRPKTFDEMISQKSIIKILEKQLELNQIKNCILFCGPSGVGKTSLSRLLANKINQGIGTPIEIDAASNNGVDNIKEIIKSAQERSLDSKYKIYILDEAHALSNQAWQALLKTIEEPPEFTIFIFCTTDPQKIPSTILNRVQRFNLTRIALNDIKTRLAYICDQEHFTNYDKSIDFIAKLADGQMRDAIANLEKAAGYSTDLNISNVLTALGNYSYDIFFNLINAVIDANQQIVLNIIADYYQAGNDLKLFVDQFLSFCIDLTKYALFKDCSILQIPESFKSELDNAINIQEAPKYYNYIIDKLLELKNIIKNDTCIKSTIEVIFTQIVRGK